MILAMDLAMFCDILSVMGPPCGHFTLNNAELSCNPPFHGSPPPPTLYPYINACGVDINYLKLWEIQLRSYAL